MRKITFSTAEIYHVFNRGVDKRLIFQEPADTTRFLQSIKEFNTLEPIGSLFEISFEKKKIKKATKPLVHIIAYCLNQNHYHLLMKQVTYSGISNFMNRLNGGYSRYSNTKDQMDSSIFQGRFKAIQVDNNNYLLHLSVYINLNNKVHQLGDRVAKLVRSSMGEYENYKPDNICKKDIVLKQFKNSKDYVQFCKETIGDIVEKRKEDKEFEKLMID